MNPALKLIRVVLVDDHPAILRQIVQMLPDPFAVVETLEDGQRLLAAIKAHQPEVIILDITLPGLSGIQLASQLRRAGGSARIIFLTVHNDPDYARAALAAGGSAYVLKMRLATDLAPALRAVIAGQRYISPSSELQEVESA
jgi:DNA-binding NarL/FixJ family response regulator